MKRQKVVIVVVIVGVALLLGLLLIRKDTPLTEQAAIAAVKQKYPSLQDYPSDKLPPRSISATQSDNKWYVAFIQNGSGRPILEARCFIVNPDHSVIENGTFAPKLEDTAQHLSPITCDSH